MKQQILNLKKKLLLVELPEDYVVVSVFPPKRTLTVWNENAQYLTEDLDFDVDEVGKLSDITESQFEQWVEAYTSLENRFRNYTVPAYIEFLMKTAKESFFSYLESQGILFSNPLGKRPFVSIFDTNPDSVVRKGYYKWEEAESKVWQLSQTYLFEIL